MFTTHKVLFKKNGENMTTPADPVRAFVEGKDEPLLTEKATFCVSFDNDMLVQANLYEVYDVVLPPWMSVEEWCADCVGWKHAWGAGIDPSWSEEWQRGLRQLSNVERVAACKLLKTKTFRSDFRKSLRAQIENWLNTADTRTHRSPLSERQWDAICDRHVALEAKRISNSLYHNRIYRGCKA